MNRQREPHLAAIAILLGGDQAPSDDAVQFTALDETTLLIDQLRTAGVILTYDMDTRTLRATDSGDGAETIGITLARARNPSTMTVVVSAGRQQLWPRVADVCAAGGRRYGRQRGFAAEEVERLAGIFGVSASELMTSCTNCCGNPPTGLPPSGVCISRCSRLGPCMCSVPIRAAVITSGVGCGSGLDHIA